MKVREILVSDLKEHESNPRLINDQAIEKVAASIKEFGFKVPIIVDGNNVIVAGHTRKLAAQRIGIDEVPVVIADDLTEEQIKAFRLADNKVAEFSEWDFDTLSEELNNIDGFTEMDFESFGFDAEDIGTEIEDEGDFNPELEAEEIRSKDAEATGLWQLGRHRLFCGDSTKKDDVFHLIGEGESVDMIFTDPPYNVNYEGGTGKTIQNDNMADNEFYMFLKDAFDAMFGVIKDGGAIYVCHADSEGRNFRNAFHDAGFLMKQNLIWVKNSLVLGRQDYQWKHEPILYGWKPGAAHNWYNDRKQTTVIEDVANLVITDDGSDKIITFYNDMDEVSIKVSDYEIINHRDSMESTVWRIDRPSRSGEHPTMKPLELCSKAIKNSSKTGDVILDSFGGSGSTLIACEQTGRSARLMEYDPVYAAVIIKRWEDYTGEKAVKIQ